MKRLSTYMAMFLLMAAWYSLAFSPVQAQTPTPPPLTPAAIPASDQPTALPETEANPADIVPFSLLQTNESGTSQIKNLQGPLDNLRFEFYLPPAWDVKSGSLLVLEGRVIISSLVAAQGNENFENMTAGQITISFDGETIHSEILKGNQTFSIKVPLPGAPFDSVDLKKHELAMVWDAQASCGYNIATSLIIDTGSHLFLPHQEKPLSLDLSAFPQPLYVEQGIQNPAITLVIPDDAGQVHLQAVLTIAAGLGRISGGLSQVSLVQEKDLTDDIQKEDHLIYVGLPGEFSRLAEALPESQDLPGALPPASGFARMLTSPWNAGRALLLASGENHEALLKTAQALSIGVLSPADQENLAIIEEINIPDPEQGYLEDVTFARMRVSEQTFTDFGSHRIVIPFNIPPATAIGSESYLDLVYGHSQMLDYIRSGLVIRLNGTPIGSARFSDTTAVGSTVRTMLPSSVLQSGVNYLEVQADLFARDICSDERLNNLFIVIYANSLLHLPAINQPAEIPSALTLGNYPRPYIDNPTLSDTAFVLPAQAGGAWRVAAQMAYDLGKQTSAEISAPAVFLADSVPADLLETHSVILVGKPSALPPLSAWKGIIPAAFSSDDSPSREIPLPVAFQTSPSANLGYLVVGSSAEKSVFGVLGNGDAGIETAQRTLNESASQAKLNQGNFAIIQRRSLFVVDIQPAPIVPTSEAGVPGVGEGVPPADGVQPTEPLPIDYGRQDPWILPVMILSLVLILLICGWQVRSALKKH